VAGLVDDLAVNHIMEVIHTMRMLELFSGSGNMAQAFREGGYEVLTVDSNVMEASLMIPVQDVTSDSVINKLGGRPDVIWASPPCTEFSVASIGKHWKNGNRPTEGVGLLAHTLRLIMELNPTYWFIENPMGMMRTLDIMKHLPRKFLTQCQYGNKAMKPTDVWTNHKLWFPKSCKNGSSCHEAAPRGSKTGTQGKFGAKERAVLPPLLCEEVAGLC